MKNVEDIYPLAPLPALLFAHALAEPGSPLLVEQFSATIEGPFDAELFYEAWRTVAARHEMLRAAPAWEGLKKPVFVVRRTVDVPFHELDWRDLSSEAQEQRRQTLLDDDRREGFDLARAPLWRLHSVQMTDARWWIVWTCHHLILDGWSLGVVLREVLAAYAQLREGREPRLAAAGAYRDYLAWLQQRDPEVDARFWREQLAGFEPARPLPIERDSESQSNRPPGHGCCERRLDRAATRRVREAARSMRVGASTIVQAAWAILLARYGETERVLFGAAVSGRPAELQNVESIVGPLVNNVPLGIDVPLGAQVAELCRQVQEQLATAQPYELFPLHDIARSVGWPEGRRPFESLVVVENYPLGETSSHRVGDITVADVQGTATSAYPLTLVALPGDSLTLRILYDRQHFSVAVAEQLLEQLIVLLEGTASRPDARVRDLALVAADDARSVARSTQTIVHDRDALIRGAILDFAGQPAPVGLPGQLHMESADGGTGIDPETKTVTGLRPTGYRAAWTADGEIEYLGPAAAPLRVGRHGVDPSEIEAVLKLHPLVADVAVVAHADHRGATCLAAFVVAASEARLAIDSGEHGLLVGQLRRFAEARLMAPLVPLVWRVVEQLPRDSAGKLDLAVLPDVVRQRPDTAEPYVAPHDEVEARVAAIWSQVLAVEPVGVHDNFLELGGYSSLAVTLLARLEDEFERRLPLAALFEQPTVAHLAAMLRSAPATAREQSLVPLREGATDAPLFCIHPAGGTVFCYLDLARRIDGGRAVFGLQAAGIDGTAAPHETVEAMAADYRHAIKSVQPDGPYHLCGWSTGGVVAFELARQLREAGDDVALVALFDAAIPREGDSFGADDLLPMLALLFPTDDAGEIDRLRELAPDEQLDYFRRRAERAELLVAGAGANQARRIYEVFQANMRAVVGYRPRACDARLTLFRAADRATPMHVDEALGWAPWAAAGVELLEIEANHLQMLQSPAVDALAAQLNAALAASADSIPATM